MSPGDPDAEGADDRPLAGAVRPGDPDLRPELEALTMAGGPGDGATGEFDDGLADGATGDRHDSLIEGGPGRSNPVDPGLSAEPGREKRSLIVPASVAGALLLAAAVVWLLTPHGPKPPIGVFESADLGCRFNYPSELTPGPNFVRASSGSLLTIERHSLEMAKKDWVAGLPEILFPQVLIQLNENYTELQEISRTPVSVDGHKGIEVVLEGRPQKHSYSTMITIDIFANADWVYVLRAYSTKDRDSSERPLFRMLRETWRFLGQRGTGQPS